MKKQFSGEDWKFFLTWALCGEQGSVHKELNIYKWKGGVMVTSSCHLNKAGVTGKEETSTEDSSRFAFDHVYEAFPIC